MPVITACMESVRNVPIKSDSRLLCIMEIGLGDNCNTSGVLI
jgi:hypothetical protein